MPPSDVPAPVTRAIARRGRREPAPLSQLPVWAGFDVVAPEAPTGEHAGVAELLGGLNPEQSRAVTHGDGPLLIVAGAGTGKTEVITRRIAWLVATRRARPSEILALTFTDKAAEEMQLRVDQLVPYGYVDTSISTFHAFGDWLIREFAFELGLSPDVRVLSRAEVVVFLRERLFELGLDAYRPLGDPTRFLGALATLFARCRDEDVSQERYLAHAARLAATARELEAAVTATPDAGDADRDAAAAAGEEAARQAELAQAFGRYTTLLRTNGAIDFGDQVSLALALLRDSAAVRTKVQARYRYVLVDEFQDTNRAQSEIVALLAERHRNVTVVGDDDQSIYRFRGAAISNILQFRERYRGARTVVLRRNYRSFAPILDAAHRLVRFNDPDRLEVKVGISKRLVPERAAPDPAPVRHLAFASPGEEADWIAGEVSRRLAAGARPRAHAVLVRANADADPILRSLTMAGIPWRFSGSSGLYGRPEVRLLLSALRAVADPGSSVDVYAIAASEDYRVPPDDLATVMSAARRRHRGTFEVLEELERQPGSLAVSGPGRAALARLLADLRRLGDLAHRRPAGEVLYSFLRDSGWLGRLVGSDSVAAEEALANVARFFDVIRAQSAILADDRAVFLAPHLATLVESGDDPPTGDPDPDVDAVAVMTVHKAKGLEFPVVFLPGLVADRFPARARRDPLALPVELVDEVLPDGDVHLQEERRLFYVAMTRARDELILTHASEATSGTARRISPFVLEALDLPANAVSGQGRAVARSAVDRIAALDGQAPTPEADRRPVEGPLTLSHSAIDDYLTCPARYRYSHVLRVPTAPHHALVYGSALHKAVQEFHRAQARGRVMDEVELLAVLDAAWTNEGFVSREHETARLAAGRDALRRFRASQLEPGTVVPAWVEREFSFSLAGDRIRGRFDRVDIVSDGSGSEPAPLPELPSVLRADVLEPTLDLLGRERVVITDYKSSDVRDPVKARQRARDSLQLQIYAMAYEAMTGRLPDAVQLHFLDSGLVGRAEVDPKRLEKARQKIATAAAGIRARAFEATPSTMSCTYCPFRDVCPSSAAR
ncbi:MAG: ATP-dependent helicase [Chloroflexi bacterium]|nr:ATP-dependent helicase [Chloroflexota bacterium]